MFTGVMPVGLRPCDSYGTRPSEGEKNRFAGRKRLPHQTRFLDCLLLLPQVDGAVIRLDCGFRAAAVDGAGDGAVQLYLEFAVGRIVLLGDGSAGEFEIEVAIDFSVIGAQFYVGLEVRRKSLIDRAVHAAEGER